MKILLGIEGGVGKNIAATGAVRVANEAEHTVDVITAWPQIWQGNPHVNKVYDWNRSEYLFEKIKEYDKVHLGDAYRHSHFLLGQTNLAGTYNYMLNGLDEPAAPDVFLNKVETLTVDDIVKGIEKPIMVVQTNGGQSAGYSWTRDIPLEEAVEMLTPFQEEYEIIHLRADGQLDIGGIKHTAELSIRQCIELLRRSDKRLLIDSVYQHAAAALDLSSVVLWVMTEPTKFGYDLHKNVVCNEPELKNMDRLEQLFKGLDANIDRCPFGATQKVFDTEKVIETIKES